MSAPLRVETNIHDDDLWSDEDDLLLLETCTENSEVNCLEQPETHPSDSSTAASVKSKNTADTNNTTSSDHELPPLQRYRPNYLWVSDLTNQKWCEQKMVYSFTVPVLVEENPTMTAGSTLHLARELAVHDVVRVQITSNEDIFAIKLMNLLTAIVGFLNGLTVAREVPIFGTPFDEDVLVIGVIDELRFDPESYIIDLLELKTRKMKSLPKESQLSQHRLQVMVYKKLFDDLVKGKLSKETVARHLKLSLEKQFGESISKHLEDKLITSKNLNNLFDFVFMKIQAMTCVSQVIIEYVHQDSHETMLHKEVFYDDDELRTQFVQLLKFWKGERKPVGVDIEESYKCQCCEFADICEWRAQKAEEHALRRTQQQNKAVS
ncbi:exonuclease V-like [Gigantopelta aegis]|uniref:exonuclease V-like n=1 Tax=Gigantopelta aegis TaxID=1735272 RepID=UPI001B887A08|nr:exonuclease V-like [Gigantopelta aegis]